MFKLSCINFSSAKLFQGNITECTLPQHQPTLPISVDCQIQERLENPLTYMHTDKISSPMLAAGKPRKSRKFSHCISSIYSRCFVAPTYQDFTRKVVPTMLLGERGGSAAFCAGRGIGLCVHAKCRAQSVCRTGQQRPWPATHCNADSSLAGVSWVGQGARQGPC